MATAGAGRAAGRRGGGRCCRRAPPAAPRTRASAAGSASEAAEPEAAAPPGLAGKAEAAGVAAAVGGALLALGGPELGALYGASAAASAAATALAVPALRSAKAWQPLREDGPRSHVASKAGTPTGGGAAFVPVGVAAGACAAGLAPEALACAAVTLVLAALGAVDDGAKLLGRSSRGVSGRTKLAVQALAGLALGAWLLARHPGAAWATVPLPWLGLAVPLGAAYAPYCAFVVAAESNAANLTDGLDGLAAGAAAAAHGALSVVLLRLGEPALAAFCACLAGASAGFLARNAHKAAVFMGDTGSLALGGSLAAAALCAGGAATPPLLCASALFTWEALSVIIQVSVFKATRRVSGEGRRVFRMTPFHHHLELGGWHETRVVASLHAAALACAALAVWVAS